ncbi:DUF420 domain-containing protein [Brevibacillus ginsengisoli]|uniref:DUF420 domain-containing protein n=1 Tax=Brevibacillus ginsengisoli TaxID=363854 RepID=UPI003CF9AB39
MLNLLPTISTSCIVISALLIAYGWMLIKQGKREAHAKVMKTASVFAAVFFVIYLSRIVFIGSSQFGGPANLKIYYHIFLIFHIVLATVGGVLGIWTLRLATTGNLAKHKKVGPVTAVTWFAVAVTGVTVYLLLYVYYPAVEKTSLFRAIFGF